MYTECWTDIYPCFQGADGLVYFCEEEICEEVLEPEDILLAEPITPEVKYAGVQKSGAIRLSLDAMVRSLERFGATVTFDPERRAEAERTCRRQKDRPDIPWGSAVQ